MIIEKHAYARAGLLGNPSDGYFGKTISISVRNFGAHISLYHSPELQIEPQIQDIHRYKNINEMVESIQLHGYYGGDRLIKAAIKKFWDYCQNANLRLGSKNFTIRYHSNIPRQVGLAGSSAIVTACMKALMEFYQIKISMELLPSLILAAEIEELGIKAGLQDRVIQVYEGCVYMDFNKKIMTEKKHGKYQRIDSQLLPKLYIAYRTDMSKVSGALFNDLSVRFAQGDPETLRTLDRIGMIAAEGKKALSDRDYEQLHQLMDENFDLRKKIMNIRDEDDLLVRTARSCGASAKFAGSGGSIIGIYRDDKMLDHLKVELNKVKARVIIPYVR